MGAKLVSLLEPLIGLHSECSSPLGYYFPSSLQQTEICRVKKKCNFRLGILPSPEPDFFFLSTQMRHICHPHESFGNGWLCQAFLRITSHSSKQPLTLRTNPFVTTLGVKSLIESKTGWGNIFFSPLPSRLMTLGRASLLAVSIVWEQSGRQ